MKKMLFFIALLVHATVFSQGKIEGTVVEKDSEEPMPFANVVLKVGDEIISGTTTDFAGKFKLEEVVEGIYTLEVSYLGYESKIIPNQEVKKSKTITVTAWLRRGIVLKEVEVIAYKLPFFERTGCRRICDYPAHEEIEKMHCISSIEAKEKAEEVDQHAALMVERDLTAFPNPSNGIGVSLNYSVSNWELERMVQIELFDLLGKRIYFKEALLLNGELKLPLYVLQTVKPGNYLIRLKDQQNVLSQKLVVSR